MTTGMLHTCAILDNGALNCWGKERMENWAIRDNDTRLTHLQRLILVQDEQPCSVSAGIDHTCAILDNGAVSCWGYGSYGALGNGARLKKLTPTLDQQPWNQSDGSCDLFWRPSHLRYS